MQQRDRPEVPGQVLLAEELEDRHDDHGAGHHLREQQDEAEGELAAPAQARHRVGAERGEDDRHGRGHERELRRVPGSRCRPAGCRSSCR